MVFSYDPAGNKSVITYPGNKTVTYIYNNTNALSTVTDWLSHTFKYTYDAAGRPLQLLYPNGLHCDYSFDNGGRLTTKKTVASPSTVITSSLFSLDAAGNRLTEQRVGAILSNLQPRSRAYSYGNDDRLNQDSIWTFTNDNAGNRLTESRGNVKATYAFTVDNLLSKFTDTAGRVNTYGYDALGNRLSKATGGLTNRYALDLSGDLAQVLQITAGNNAIRSQYVYGTGLLERVDSTGNVLYYHYDAQHNTVALSDAAGVIKDTYTYDPFGTLQVHQGNTNQPFTFLGEYGVQQEHNSMYFDRARYYDAANGRFLSKDPYPATVFDPQTVNRYVYSVNNPVLIFDYDGLYGNYDNDGSTETDYITVLGEKATTVLGPTIDAAKKAKYLSKSTGMALEATSKTFDVAYTVLHLAETQKQYDKGEISRSVYNTINSITAATFIAGVFAPYVAVILDFLRPTPAY